MRILYKILLLISLILILPGVSLSQSPSTLETVSFCELVNNIDKYVGQAIRLKGIYRFAFENSEIYCSHCVTSSIKVWVTFDQSLCEKSKKIKKYRHTQFGEAEVLFVGTLASSGSYGHMGFYNYEFKVYCVESSKTFLPKPSEAMAKTSCN